jgi:thioredoxin 1
MRVPRFVGLFTGDEVRRGRTSDETLLTLQRRLGTWHQMQHPWREPMSKTVAVTDDTFANEIEAHQGLAVVDFWATWCGPCRMIAPILDQLSEEFAGRVKVTKLDVDANQKTAMRFQVRSIPTLLFFKDGKLVDQVIGAVPKPALAAKFEQHAA